MTIIYGFNVNGTVVLAADRRSAIFGRDGQPSGAVQNERAKKVVFDKFPKLGPYRPTS